VLKMGLLNKLAFWKKEPELPDLGDLGKDSGFKGPGGAGETGFGKPDMGEKGSGQGFDQLGLGGQKDLMADIEPGMPQIEPGYGGGPGLGQGPGGMQQPRQQQRKAPSAPQQPFGAPIQPVQPSQMEYTMSKDIEIVSSKLDALKATLDGVNQRLANLERLMQNKRNW
jgi:hypothetical protein